MNPNLDSLLSHGQKSGITLGLDNIYKLLANLGNPHLSIPFIHVAGSNGKGSVCAYLSSVLIESGYKVGTYISPHLVNWNERITINQVPIDDSEFISLLLTVKNTVKEDEKLPSVFELITAVSWVYFAQQKIDIAVIEVGLGGRLDSTNVRDNPLVSIITSISREHWQILGDSLAQIASEKAGILKPNCPAVIGQLPSEAMTVVKQRITELNCPSYFPESAQDLGNNWAEFEGIRYFLPLFGQFQLNNSTVAIKTLQVLQSQGWNITNENIISGIKKTKWTGRVEWKKWRDKEILIDGAHNVEGAIALRYYVDTLGKNNINWVMGMLANKDHEGTFKTLLKKGDRLYLVPVPAHHFADLDDLKSLAENICPELADCQIFSDVKLALDYITEIVNQDDLIVLCGSLYLLGSFLKMTSNELC